MLIIWKNSERKFALDIRKINLSRFVIEIFLLHRNQEAVAARNQMEDAVCINKIPIPSTLVLFIIGAYYYYHRSYLS